MTLDRNFRAAINGFNRSDVVNYIEECSINHERALRQLRDENARLRADLEKLQAEKDALEAGQPEPEAPEAEVTAAPEAPEAAPQTEAPAAPEPVSSGEELAAYRRAEAVERSARNRAAALCRQVNEIVDNASQKFESSRGDVNALMSDLNICLRRLNDTFADLRMTFDDTAGAFASVESLSEDADN